MRRQEASTATADELFAVVYDELRVLAHRELRRVGGGAGSTLNTTALVHESYLKLARNGSARWGGRAQFFATAAKAMRHTLVDYHRERGAAKRRGHLELVTLHGAETSALEPSVDLVALDEALRHLGGRDPRLERVVECRFFGDMTVDETGRAMGDSTRTAARDWTRARAYLYRGGAGVVTPKRSRCAAPRWESAAASSATRTGGSRIACTTWARRFGMPGCGTTRPKRSAAR